jgi:hypothetical protein
MAAIRYLVPYELSIQARDVGSGKPVTNIMYYICGLQNVAPPAYGAPIAGASSNGLLVTNLRALWAGAVLPRLNANYKVLQYVLRAIIGKRFATPSLAISALVTGTPTVITTAAPHGFSSGMTVSVSGVTLPVVTNGLWVITVLSSTSFSLNGSVSAGAWSGDGAVQEAGETLEFQYADLATYVPVADIGGVVGDALPLFATSSVRRLNTGIGRHFRSRFSLSPMSEVDALDGGFTAAQKALMATALGAFNVSVSNGGSDASSSLMAQWAVSKRLAFTLPSPFTQSLTWTAFITNYVQQPNCGSLVRRKPRLTSVIV